MVRIQRSFLCVAALAIVSGGGSCGGKSATTPASDSDSGVVTDSGNDSASDVGVSPACPSSAPGGGAACTREGAVCEYGDDPRWNCRTTATCTAGKFVVTPPNAGCTPTPPATCPATREAAAGNACTPKDAYCSYAGLSCHCTNCTEYPIVSCSGPLTWRCDSPNTEASCPAALPNAGTACTAPEGKQCVYGCERDRSRTCTSGVWVASSSPGGCPISSRRYKTNIEYLAQSDLDRLARDVLSLRLATYDYKDPALAGKKHLGFIIEDSPTIPAVDTAGDRVDLYGYTSMAIAALQSQGKELAALRAEVKALREEIAAMRKAKPVAK